MTWSLVNSLRDSASNRATHARSWHWAPRTRGTRDHPGGDRARSGARWMGDMPSPAGVTTTDASNQKCVSPRNIAQPNLRRRCTRVHTSPTAAARILTALS
jgi:hypothetical protein